MNEFKVALKDPKKKVDEDIFRRNRLSPDSTYVDTKRGYHSYVFGDVLMSCGNPLIGHEIKEKRSRLTKAIKYSKRKDVHFEDFVMPLVEKPASSFVYDITPMKNLYLTLKKIEENVSIGVDLARCGLEVSHEPSLYEMLEFNAPTKRDRRFKLLKNQYQHSVLKNAMKVLEDNFSSLVE